MDVHDAAEIRPKITSCEPTFVDPLIGSQRGGNVFAGATLPYGLAKAVADVDGERTGGFATDGSNITGFSIVHDSGTGGNPSLGNFPLFPQVCPGDELNNCRFRIGDRAIRYDVDKTIAEPGYGNEHPLVMLDLTDLWASRQNASLRVDTPTGRMTGNGTFLPSFGAGSYVLYYYVDFFGASVFDTGVWVNNRAGNEPKELFITRGFNLFYLEGGGFVRFKELADNTVTARMGVSFKSSAQACSNAEKEIPDLERLEDLEYSYNDYCLATLAKGLGDGGLHDKYMTSSMNWQNIWKSDQKSLINMTDTKFTGFFQPKYMNGTWGYQDPIACSTLAGFCSLTTNPSETFEASIWQYQFIVPHAASTLIDLMGGDDAFVRRLNYFHASPLADISNEPVFLTVYLYHYAGRPGLSAQRIHQYIPSAFNSTRGGLPGNDDSGAMGAFLAFSTVGLFPVAGQDVYLITPPFFEEVSFKSPTTGKTATVKAVGFDAEYRNVFVQSASVDGQP
ncbi:glycosyl hydrolase family 92 [Colletotrichum musicola]|uniref:Glycosyl hydrolase family 92 n=1 Tax=Colletotrichum musicola TaxID=2175873 RepID=A0A8H6NKA2_9PEZI|nr:glycosyl hydrolase family 92 [Colletotrichum musicola]